ncbi:MAG: hypothetical protein GEU83_09030 [Pseudonocardiaceae bacterium]|nr:hypothetical protein [Pseudonocardiaceae bacterium]
MPGTRVIGLAAVAPLRLGQIELPTYPGFVVGNHRGRIPVGSGRVRILVIPDAGNHWLDTIALHSLKEAGGLQLNCGIGAMGWAIGASVGIAMANPDQLTVCVTGDGCMLMSGAELSVAAKARSQPGHPRVQQPLPRPSAPGSAHGLRRRALRHRHPLDRLRCLDGCNGCADLQDRTIRSGGTRPQRGAEYPRRGGRRNHVPLRRGTGQPSLAALGDPRRPASCAATSMHLVVLHL